MGSEPPSEEALPRRLAVVLLFIFFFGSGFCGLAYQVVWLRLAFAQFGVITPVLSVVVSLFMLGLSLGTWLGGRSIGRLVRRTGRSAIQFYAATEMLISLGAFAVPLLLRWGERLVRPAGEIDSGAYLGLSAAVIAVSLLPWCICMGATFPIVAAYMRERGYGTRTEFSFLYLANVMGAMVGVLFTALVLIETMGSSGTLLVCGGTNLGIAVGARLLGTRTPLARRSKEHEDAPRAGKEPRHAARTTLAILFVTGFTSMAMEVVWIRSFTPLLGTTVYTFAGLLAAYLFATTAGTFAYRLLLWRGRALGTFETLAWCGAAAVLPLVAPDPFVMPSRAIALASILPFCFALGYLTPKLIDEHSGGDPRSIGQAYACNVFGSILGPLLAGYLLLPTLGVKASLLALSAPYPALLLLRRARPGVGMWTGAVASLALIAHAGMVSRTFEDPGLYTDAVVHRDHTATVISALRGGEKALFVNGMSITRLTPITKMMAHLPAAARATPPRHSLVICFGMGTTVRSLRAWHGRVTAVELVPSVRDAFGYYFADAREVLSDPAVKVVIDDGRRFLRRTSQHFDVATIDPPPPIAAAGSSLLYSVEFYQLLRTRLTDDAVVQQWLPGGDTATQIAIARALSVSFAHVRAFRSVDGWGVHFLASQRPLTHLDPDIMLRRLPAAVVQDLAEWVPRARIPALFRTTLGAEIPMPVPSVDGKDLVLTDDRPVNEYYALRQWRSHTPHPRP